MIQIFFAVEYDIQESNTEPTTETRNTFANNIMCD
jgi:hypothetical protein